MPLVCTWFYRLVDIFPLLYAWIGSVGHFRVAISALCYRLEGLVIAERLKSTSVEHLLAKRNQSPSFLPLFMQSGRIAEKISMSRAYIAR